MTAIYVGTWGCEGHDSAITRLLIIDGTLLWEDVRGVVEIEDGSRHPRGIAERARDVGLITGTGVSRGMAGLVGEIVGSGNKHPNNGVLKKPSASWT